MFIYAGIDEAGYGPMFGPFVIARSVFAINDLNPPSNDGPPDLWQILDRALCKKANDRRQRLAINDSKKLYSPSTGLARLERGVLTMLALAGHTPNTLDQFIEAVALDSESRVPDILWYTDPAGGPTLPTILTDGQLAITRAQLTRAAVEANVALPHLCAAIIFEDRFNTMVKATRSKARTAWTFIGRHIYEVWQAFGQHHPWIVVDRQGGRRVYHEQLEQMFEHAEVQLIDESEDISRYRVTHADRSAIISFEVESEINNLPVALASMTAKYTRELLMTRFNAFWKSHHPALKPTAGYVQDGRRFLRDIEIHIDRLNIDRSALIRAR
ncbi:MAG: hypothetical protein CMJ49_02585 [Planctomycetaceae bacterium]|nr:hypothetical protein [Planctomycetaceae bacterium]